MPLLRARRAATSVAADNKANTAEQPTKASKNPLTRGAGSSRDDTSVAEDPSTPEEDRYRAFEDSRDNISSIGDFVEDSDDGSTVGDLPRQSSVPSQRARGRG